MLRNATISPCGTYRASLMRCVDVNCSRKCCEGPKIPQNKGFVLWVMNNPSTADGEVDDATIRRTWDFTRRFGYTAMQIANTNPTRATNPKDASVPREEIMLMNDNWLTYLHKLSALTICAWGDKAHEVLARRAVRLLYPLGPLLALRVTKSGNPQHPLYLPASTLPQAWSPTQWIH